MLLKYPKILIFFFIIIHLQSNLYAQLRVNVAVQEPSCYSFTNGSATAQATGGTGNYTYRWSNGQAAGATVYGIGVGTYYVTVSSGAESVTYSFIMTEPPQLITQILPVGGICGTPQDTFRVSVSGGTPPYNYEWRQLSTNVILGNQRDLVHPSQNTYILTVKDAKLCARVMPLNITEPMVLNTNATPSNCIPPFNGGVVANVIGGKPPFNYRWDKPQNIGNQSNINNLPPNTYRLTVTDGNGCTKMKAVEVPPINNYQLSTWVEGGLTVCKSGESRILRATTNAPNLRWSDMNGNKIDSTIVSKNQDVVYIATIGDSLCSRRDTVKLVNQSVQIQLDTIVNLCWYDKRALNTKNLRLQDNLNMSWTPASFINGSNTILNPIVKGETNGFLKGRFQNQYGCVLDTSVRINGLGRFKATLSAFKNNKLVDSSTSFLPNDRIRYEATPNNTSYTYQWTANPTGFALFGGIRDAKAEVILKQTTDVNVMIRDNFGCIDTLSAWNGMTGKVGKRLEIIPFACNERSVFLPEAFSPNDDGDNDILFVQSVILEKTDFELSVYSRWGQLMFSTPDPNHGWDGKVNGVYAQPDAYMVCIKGKCADGMDFNRKQLVLLKR